MINDRGSKKWVSLMLPEHVEALKKVFAEEEHKEKPILDEQQKAENDLILQKALKKDLLIEVKYFKEHDFHVVEGKVSLIESLMGYLQLDSTEIKLKDIIEVNLL